MLEHLLHRGDTAVHYAAGHDTLEPSEVYVDIERETVRRHPGAARADGAADANAYRRNLVAPHPDAGQAALQSTLDAEVSQSTKNYFLEIADVIDDPKARRP